MGVIKTIVSSIFVLLIAIALKAETRSIFQKGDKAGELEVIALKSQFYFTEYRNYFCFTT